MQGANTQGRGYCASTKRTREEAGQHWGQSLPMFSATTGMQKSPLDLPRSGAAKDSFGGRAERKENIHN